MKHGMLLAASVQDFAQTPVLCIIKISFTVCKSGCVAILDLWICFAAAHQLLIFSCCNSKSFCVHTGGPLCC